MRESAKCLLSLVFSQAPQSSDGLAFLVSELPPGVLSQTITFEDTDPSFNAT